MNIQARSKMHHIAALQGWTVIDHRPVSEHPEDDHLLYVIVHKNPQTPDMWKKAAFIGFTYNGAEGCEGFCSGNYDLTLLSAAAWFHNKGNS